MKKKAFVTIYVLLLLLILSITVAFIYDQNKNDTDFTKDLYNKKQALYTSESLANLAIKDKSFEDYKKRVYENIKNYYDYLIVRGSTLDESNKNKEGRQVVDIDYESISHRVKFIHIRNIDQVNRKTKEIIRIQTLVPVGDTRAYTEVDYIVKPKFDFTKKDSIIYDFKEDLKFKQLDFKEDTASMNLEEDLKKDKYYKFNSSILIKDQNENNKLKTDEKSENVEYFSLLYIKGDLILETDFSIDGLLILEGNIISKPNKNNKNPKLKLRGQLISKYKPNDQVLDFTYEKHFYEYIKYIDNLFQTELITKKVY